LKAIETVESGVRKKYVLPIMILQAIAGFVEALKLIYATIGALISWPMSNSLVSGAIFDMTMRIPWKKEQKS